MSNFDHLVNKYPAVEGLDLIDTQSFLRTADGWGTLNLREAIRIFKCDAPSADSKLRSMALAGFIETDSENPTSIKWKRTALGNALALEKKTSRVKPERATEIIEAVTARGHEINSDPDRLHRIKLKVFGSAVDENAADYGDVDVAVEFIPRQLDSAEEERIKAALKERCKPENMNYLQQLFMVEHQDMKEIKAVLKKGFGPLSLMGDDPAELGSSYRWLIDHDVEADRPRPVPISVVRPNTPPPEVGDPKATLLPETTVKATVRPLADHRKIPWDELSFYKASEAAELEENVWTPVIHRDGTMRPKDLRADRSASFAGFQHLCPAWKEDTGSVEMLDRSIDWCEDNKVWLKDVGAIVSISKHDRSNIIRLGWAHPDHLVTKVGRDNFDAKLLPPGRKTVSKLDLAGAYSVAFSLANMYREMGCFKMPHFDATILIAETDQPFKIPDLPKLLKAGELEKGGIDGRLFSFELDEEYIDTTEYVVRSSTPNSPHFVTADTENPTTYDRADAARYNAVGARREARRWSDDAQQKGYAYKYVYEPAEMNSCDLAFGLDAGIEP